MRTLGYQASSVLLILLRERESEREREREREKQSTRVLLSSKCPQYFSYYYSTSRDTNEYLTHLPGTKNLIRMCPQVLLHTCPQVVLLHVTHVEDSFRAKKKKPADAPCWAGLLAPAVIVRRNSCAA